MSKKDKKNRAIGRCSISATSTSPRHPQVAIYEAPGHQTHATFLLAHEGLSFPQVEGQIGNTLFKWTEEGIRSLGSAIENDTPIYRGHSSRKQIGAVIGSYLEKAGGGLRSVIVGRFPGGIDHDIDTCSLEADIEYDLSDNSVREVIDVTGVAVESLARERPGFPEARIMGKATFLKPKEEEEMDKKVEEKDSPSIDAEKITEDVYNRLYKRFSEENPVKSSDSGETKDDILREQLKEIQQRQTWEHRFKKMLPKELTETQQNFINGRISAEEYSHRPDDEAKLAITRALEDEYPRYKKLFSEPSTNSAAPVASGESSDQQESIAERAYKALIS